MDSTTWELAIFKNALTLTLVSWITYLQIDSQVFFLFWILLFFDYIVWIAAAKKMNRFSKKEAVDWIISKTLLLIIPLSLWVLWRINWYDVTSVMSAIFWALWIAEFYSILWWIYEFRSWKRRQEVDFTSLVIQKLLSIIKGILKNILNKNYNNEIQWIAWKEKMTPDNDSAW